ncbi:MAG: ABC transporter permease [Nitriliruptorales bacterium]
METLLSTLEWFTNPANWSGGRGIPVRLLEHAELSFIPLLAAAAVAIPAGVLSGHFRRFQGLGALLSNAGRAIPTLALLVFTLIFVIRVLGVSIRWWPRLSTMSALFFLALQPIFANTYTAVRDVDPGIVEAARGMGMRERDIVARTEMPIAAPVILTAVRISAVQIVATAPLAALVAGGGLGRFILDGFQQFRYGQMYGGILLVAAFAIVTEWLIDRVERIVVPTGVRGASVAEVAATGRAV